MGQPVLGRTASNRVTWAATTRQPSAVRSHVCIWRPNLPDETRRYSQLAVAKSVELAGLYLEDLNHIAGFSAVALQQQAPPLGPWVPAFALHREFGQGGQARFGVFAHGTIDKAAPAGRPAAQGLLRRIQNRLEGLAMATSLQ